MKKRKHLILPLLIFLVVISASGYALIEQKEYSVGFAEIVKLLLYLISIIGGGFIALVAHIFNTLVKRIDKIAEKTDKTYDLCLKHDTLINQLSIFNKE